MMGILRTLRVRFRALVSSERGFALPTALFATIASLGLASAAVMASVDVQQGTKRDSGSKSAIAAADAGASIALLRLNRYATAFTASTPCLAAPSGTLVLSAASTGGWCPGISGTVGSAAYSYWVGPAALDSTRTVVATGTAGNVTRRIAISFKTTTVGGIFDGAGVIGQDKITLTNNSDIRVGVGTNGDVSLSNSANICGNIRRGVGKKVTFENSSGQCSGYGQSEGNQTLPEVSTFMPTDIATNNYDFRLAWCTKTSPVPVPTGCEEDSYTDKRSTTVPWDPTTRTILTNQNETLTLGGGDYWICRLVLGNNSHLIMKSGAKVRLFFDTPENCGVKAGGTQVEISNHADITATGYQPTLGNYEVPGLYLLGSTTTPTVANWSNNTETSELIFYAPHTDISIDNNATYVGILAGKTVTIGNHAVVKQDAGFKGPPLGGATIYQRQSYVECTGPTASPPNAYC